MNNWQVFKPLNISSNWVKKKENFILLFIFLVVFKILKWNNFQLCETQIKQKFLSILTTFFFFWKKKFSIFCITFVKFWCETYFVSNNSLAISTIFINSLLGLTIFYFLLDISKTDALPIVWISRKSTNHQCEVYENKSNYYSQTGQNFDFTTMDLPENGLNIKWKFRKIFSLMSFSVKGFTICAPLINVMALFPNNKYA